VTCGAECTGEDEASYLWFDDQCTYNCNDYLATDANDCTYYSSIIDMACTTPNPSDPECFTDAWGNQVCPHDPTYMGDIDSQVPFYMSYCRNSETCYYNVTCAGFGIYQAAGEQCLNAGSTEDEFCYYHPSGQVQCEFNGSCSYVDEWDIACDSGSYSGSDCRVAERCYNTSCSATDGWARDFDDDIYLGSLHECTDISCTSGFYNESGTCYYGIACGPEGWQYSASEPLPPSPCTGNWDCTASGWQCT
jgi:hypothetical protein